MLATEPAKTAPEHGPDDTDIRSGARQQRTDLNGGARTVRQQVAAIDGGGWTASSPRPAPHGKTATEDLRAAEPVP